MSKKVKVIGLQRSGTNYLEELIRLNFSASVFSNPLKPFFKHAFPIEAVINITPVVKSPGDHTKIAFTQIPKEAIAESPNVLFLLIQKDYGKWVQSIDKYPADLQVKRPELFSDGKFNHVLANDFYNDYHFQWRQIKACNLIFIQYKDLIKDFGAVLKNLPLRSKVNDWLNVNKVGQSELFTEERRKFYLN